MTKTTLIFVRHGYSLANEQNIFAGITDVPLTEVGKEQARLTAHYLSRYAIEKLYSSDLQRAMQTAQPIAEQTGLPIIQNAQLREMDLGEWEKLPFEAVVQEYPKEYELWMNDVDNAVAPGGESVPNLQKRMIAAVEKIIADNKGKTVCIVTHAEALRVLFSAWTGKRLVDVAYVPNSSVTVMEHNGKECSVVLDGFAEHLGDLATRLPVTV